MKDVMILTGAGQIGMAIARRMGYGMKIVIGDKKPENAQAIAEIMNNAGFDAVAMEMDLSSRDSVLSLIAKAKEYGKLSGIHCKDTSGLYAKSGVPGGRRDYRSSIRNREGRAEPGTGTGSRRRDFRIERYGSIQCWKRRHRRAYGCCRRIL